MDRNKLILPGVIILIAAVIIITLSLNFGDSTFETGNLYFQYPNSWNNEQIIGTFDNNSLFSQVILTANIPNGESQKSYIIIQMQKKSNGTFQLPGTNTIVMNTTNSTVGSTNVGNITATQFATYGPSLAQKVTIVDKANNYYIISYLCPPNAANQTSKDYNSILATFKIQ